ncbi:MAG TPA: hypothetical protein VNM90_16865, partial [Haliangium sp.]|nr:hypothetical protein [Haliangium sp.]
MSHRIRFCSSIPRPGKRPDIRHGAFLGPAALLALAAQSMSCVGSQAAGPDTETPEPQSAEPAP